jgi:eukaryotic-like serine/threonine-protein kinase
METNAAHNLLGKKLKNGWEVIEKLEKLPGQTGSFFSVCYTVKKDKEICFLKAFDFAKFFHVSQISGESKSIVDVMSDMISAYKYERDLSELCKSRKVTKVAFVKEANEEMISGYSIPVVPYLIFDLADGDVRKKLIYNNNLDLAWKLNSLHSVAVGLRQLHNINVSHQDMKPSNVLMFGSETKIGDIGRSICEEMESPFGELVFNGDWSYAPPELLYKYYIADWKKRAFATDTYLLGSMIVFYFTGVNMNALIRQNMQNEISWEFWRGGFDEVKDYLIDAFHKAILEFQESISGNLLKNELKTLVEYLCYPIPEKRGHVKNLLTSANQYDLERIVSKLAFLHEKARFYLLN